jgi:RHS repeat-associated protein
MSAANRTTEYEYTLEGQLAVLIARNEETGDQVTRWHYGTTLAESGVASNSLLRAKIYPESDDEGPGLNGPDDAYDRVEYQYNRQGEVIEQKDQNETVHAYEYDRLGRLTHDRVTALGTGIDGAVRRISRSYDRAGQMESITSWNEPEVGRGEVVNQVLQRYNGFGQLTAEYQSHGGAVSTSATPAVRYTYADGSNRHIRRLSTIYPDGRELAFYYGAPGSDDDKLGRVQEIRDGGAEGTPLARYTRRGLSATMRIEYLQCGGETPVEMTYIKLPDDPVGPAGDQYTGQDQFNRIINVRWMRGGSAPVHIDRFQYGFDRAGNRTYRRNVPGRARHYDEKYSYDGLYQLTELERGTLSLGGAEISHIIWQEDFTYDPTGNWLRYEAQTGGSPSADQTRTHNRANEITSTANPSVPLGYDRAGNMTRQGDSGNDHHLAWDAWNRLVQASHADASIVGRYQYDGLTRRVWKRTLEGGLGLADRHFYYSDQWQVLEERFGDLSVAQRQFVWGLRYADDLILRDSPDPLPQYNRLYATHDQWHCTGIVDETGEVVQRYAYDAFGNPLALSAGFFPSDYFYYWETKFGAYRWDWETETYQVRFRHYQPRLGRWLSRDPVQERGGLRLFAYVENNAANAVDSKGLRPNSVQEFANKYKCSCLFGLLQDFRKAAADNQAVLDTGGYANIAEYWKNLEERGTNVVGLLGQGTVGAGVGLPRCQHDFVEDIEKSAWFNSLPGTRTHPAGPLSRSGGIDYFKSPQYATDWGQAEGLRIGVLIAQINRMLTVYVSATCCANGKYPH